MTVFGPDYAKCVQAEQAVKQAVEEAGVEADVANERDIAESTTVGARMTSSVRRDCPLTALDDVIRSMTLEFFGSGKHKIEMEDLLATEEAILLDVRSAPEWESIQLRLEHHIKVLWIPTHEIPDRLDEIPRDKTVGVFCTNGPRSAMVYLYLRSEGFEHVRIAPSNYEAITSLLLPGKLLKFLRTRGVAGQGE